MKQKLILDEYTCDSCGKSVTSPKNDITEAFGIHGTVIEITKTSGSANVEWFACSRICIPEAIINALKRAYS